MMKWELLTGPASAPVTVSEVKERAVVDFDDDDTLLTRLIDQATDFAENWTGRKFMAQQYLLFLDYWPSVIELPFFPVSAIDSIQYVDEAEVTQTLATDVYEADLKCYPPKIRPAMDQSWPSLDTRYNAVTVTFTTGYASAAKVPEAVKGGIAMLATHLYLHREGEAALPPAVEHFLNAWKV